MTLRTKTLIIIGGVLGILFLLFFIVVQGQLLRTYARLEEQRAAEDLQRVLNAINQRLDRLYSLSGSYTFWDDTFFSIESAYPDFVDENPVVRTFQQESFNLILYRDLASGRIYYSQNVLFEPLRQIPTPIEIFEATDPGTPLFEAGRGADPDAATGRPGVTGFIMLEDQPLMVAAVPIDDSLRLGGAEGTLILGRYFDQAEIEGLRRTTRLNLEVFSADDPTLPEGLSAGLAAQSEGSALQIVNVDETTLHGYALLRDIYGAPLLIIQMEQERGLYQTGLESVRFFEVALGFTALVVVVLAGLLLEALVLSRVQGLSEDVRAIQAGGSPQGRVNVQGNDELGRLAQDINGMLARLAESQEALAHSKHQLEEQNAALAAAREKAEEAVRVKSEFLATMSHELRTPLNTVIGFSEMMLMGIGGSPLEATHRRYTERIKANGHRLLALINDVLDLSRIEAGRMELRRTPFSPQALAERLAAQTEALHRDKKFTFAFHIDPQTPQMVMGDEQRVEQVILNLLSNAFKFTQEGSVTLSLGVDLAADSWSVAVADTGVGIPPHAIDLIFEEFRQVDGSSTKEHPGTGLGLAITRKLVHMMGGRISVTSELDKGSVFIVVLPLHRPEDEAAALKPEGIVI